VGGRVKRFERPWAPYERSRGAVKMHTLLDLRGSIPSFIHITHGRVHDVHTLDQITFEPGAFYVMDRGYVDFRRLFRIHQSGAFFVTRPLCTTRMLRQYSRVVARATGLRADQTVRLNGLRSHRDYPVPLRRVSYRDLATGKRFVFFTNNFLLPALTIAQLYQSRWSIEVFFKWIKQHLRITSFMGNSPNAIKTQIWIAVSVYVLIAIAKKQLGVKASLYTFLEVIGLTLFEKMPILQVFEEYDVQADDILSRNQLSLFDF